MPEITQYTRRVQPTGLQRTQASPQAFGSQLGQQIQAQGQKLEEASQKRMNRIDTINRARLLEKYKQDVMNETVRVQNEDDLIDPTTPKRFNETIRSKAEEALSSFSGSEDARAQLILDIESAQSRFSNEMNTYSLGQQRKFILDSTQKEIEPLVDMVRNDPNSFGQAYSSLNDIISKNSGAMYAEDEISFLDASRDTIARAALESFIDVGQYEEAKEIINENPLILNGLSQKSKQTIVGQIQSGLSAQKKMIDETRAKITVAQSAAQDLGVDVSASDLFSYATGLEINEEPIKRLQKFAEFTGTSVNELPMAGIAKAGFGISMPETTGMTDERKFIIDTIKSPVEEALTVKTRVDSVIDQADAFFETNNQQAGLAAMIAFQKLIDDGAAVREGDIRLSAEGVSAFDKIKLQMQKIEEGGIATPEQMRQMVESSKVFLRAALSSKKGFIDPYLADARQQGFVPRQIGIPQQSYDSIFSGVSSAQDVKNKNQEFEAIASERGVSLEEMIQMTAEKHGKTPEQVKKDLGID